MDLSLKKGMPGWLNLDKILIEGQESRLLKVYNR